MFTQKELGAMWWVRNRVKIMEALDVIDTALEEYDEMCGLAFSDIPEKFRDLQNFFSEVCYPDFK